MTVTRARCRDCNQLNRATHHHNITTTSPRHRHHDIVITTQNHSNITVPGYPSIFTAKWTTSPDKRSNSRDHWKMEQDGIRSRLFLWIGGYINWYTQVNYTIYGWGWLCHQIQCIWFDTYQALFVSVTVKIKLGNLQSTFGYSIS